MGKARGGCGRAREFYRSMTLIVCSLVAVMGCGDSPTAPSIQEALIITKPGSGLAFLPLGGVPLGGVAQGEIRNAGPGCASNVGGVTRLFDQANVQVARLAWFFPDRVVQSGETSFYEACCLSRDAWDSWQDGGSFRAEFTWRDSSCRMFELVVGD